MFKKNPKTAYKILDLVEAICQEPFGGIGKPERLKYLNPNTWSRRITQEHRLVYRVTQERIDFLAARIPLLKILRKSHIN